MTPKSAGKKESDMKVYEFNVKVNAINESSWTITERNVIGENKQYIVIDDERFTTLAKKSGKYNYETVVEHASLIDWTTPICVSSCMGKFSLTLFSYSDSASKAEMKCNKMLREYISEKISRYLPFENVHIFLNEDNKNK